MSPIYQKLPKVPSKVAQKKTPILTGRQQISAVANKNSKSPNLATLFPFAFFATAFSLKQAKKKLKYFNYNFSR